jgi:hypothetical protein
LAEEAQEEEPVHKASGVSTASTARADCHCHSHLGEGRKDIVTRLDGIEQLR